MSDAASAESKKVLDLIEGMRIGMLTTRAPDGKLRSRPMAVSDTRTDGRLYFLTRDDSGKVHDLENDKEVVVTFADPGKSSYVALRGEGTITKDRDKVGAHWSEPSRAWFPKGKDDPHLALITVTIDEAEYWDPPSGTMVVAFGYVKALLTGEAAKQGGPDHGKVRM